MASGLRILVPIKRVIDYAVSIVPLHAALRTGDRGSETCRSVTGTNQFTSQLRENILGAMLTQIYCLS